MKPGRIRRLAERLNLVFSAGKPIIINIYFVMAVLVVMLGLVRLIVLYFRHR